MQRIFGLKFDSTMRHCENIVINKLHAKLKQKSELAVGKVHVSYYFMI